MAGGRYDDATPTTGAIGVAELYRRLDVAPPRDPDADPAGRTGPGRVDTGTFVPVGELLRREGRPLPAPAAPPEPAPAADRAPAIPVPRRRAAGAARSALGAGGLVVAGSVLGVALFAAAGLDVPLPPWPSDGQGTDGLFDGVPGPGGGSAVRSPVTGQRVVALSGLVRQAYAQQPAAPPPGAVRGVAAPAAGARPGAATGGARHAAPAAPAVGVSRPAPPRTTASGPTASRSAGPVGPVTATAAATVTAAPRAVLAPATKVVAPVAAAGRTAVGTVDRTAKSVVGDVAAGGGAAVERTAKKATQEVGKAVDSTARDAGRVVEKSSGRVADTAEEVTGTDVARVVDTDPVRDVGGLLGGRG
ncbi:MAG TPA: hypothetical protein VF667_06220 [Pseudonocardia sp.]